MLTANRTAPCTAHLMRDVRQRCHRRSTGDPAQRRRGTQGHTLHSEAPTAVHACIVYICCPDCLLLTQLTWADYLLVYRTGRRYDSLHSHRPVRNPLLRYNRARLPTNARKQRPLRLHPPIKCCSAALSLALAQQTKRLHGLLTKQRSALRFQPAVTLPHPPNMPNQLQYTVSTQDDS